MDVFSWISATRGTRGVMRRHRDMGDGTHAEVVVAHSGGVAPGVAQVVKSTNGVTTAGAVDALPADAARTSLTVRNDSDAKMYVRFDGPAGDGVGYPLDAGRGYELPQNMMPAGAVSLWCATAGKRWAALYSSGSSRA